jgi:hypothetical protein
MVHLSFHKKSKSLLKYSQKVISSFTVFKRSHDSISYQCIINSCCRGAVAVSMDIKMLDVNQCNGDYHTPNAFKRTHKCDERTSYVSVLF